jgi:hypothetical protein
MHIHFEDPRPMRFCQILGGRAHGVTNNFEESYTIVVFITLITFLFTSLDPIFSEP